MTEKEIVSIVHEPIIGHHVKAQIYEPEQTEFDKELEALQEKLDIEGRDRRRVKIEVGDVAWEETKEISVDVQTFRQLCSWFGRKYEEMEG